jgi:hypothetical protein
MSELRSIATCRIETILLGCAHLRGICRIKALASTHHPEGLLRTVERSSAMPGASR